MIKIRTYSQEHVLKATIFPDGTSQVWKLPEWLITAREIAITWNFESERELIDLLSLRALLPDVKIDMHIPYLPYARQDKDVDNDSTFNLEILAQLLNRMFLEKVTSVDVHNPVKTKSLINGFINTKPEHFHHKVLDKTKYQAVVYPDAGAAERYRASRPKIVCTKVRNQATGEITGHAILDSISLPDKDPRVLIIDDICDGGATFISVAKILRETYGSNLKVDLFVTHGIFSKGREHLLTNGIDAVYTTNSLLKNNDGYEV